MSKCVYKLIPCNRWQIGETESWLSDMAEAGLFLKKFGIRFAKFVKAEPCKIRYRIDYYSKLGKMPYEQLLAYGESGWKLSCSHQKFYIFCAPDDIYIPELHTDAAEQGYSLSSLNTRIRIACIFNVLCFLLFLYFNYLTLSSQGTYYLNLLDIRMSYALLFNIPLLIILLFPMIIECISISKLKKSLIEGVSINHKAPWKPSGIIAPKVELSIILVFFIVVFIFYTIVAKNSTNFVPITNNSPSLPIITLSEVEETPYIDWNNSRLNKIENTHWYTKGWSPLAPFLLRSNEIGVVQEISNQNGKLINKLSSNKKYIYTPSIYTEVYQVRFLNMVKTVFLDLVKANNPLWNSEYSSDAISKIDNDDFDLLYANKNKTKIFASRGRGIIYVKYSGEADFDRILEVISEKLKLIE